MVDFYHNLKKTCKEYAEIHGKPDVIYASSVHPLTLVAGIQLAKQFHIKCICEVRDLWPESLLAYGIVGTRNPVVFGLRQMEKWIYKKADALVFTAEGMYEYIKEQGWEKAVPKNKTFYINNGVDLEAFDQNLDTFQIRDDDLENSNFFKVVYTGSIRKVNNLGLLLDTAKLIGDSSIRFLIWGGGDELEILKERINDEKIDNVILKGRVKKCYIPYITSRADLNLVHNTPSPLFKYGISFNKLFDYLAAGKPIFSDFPCAYNPAVQCGAGCDVREPRAEIIAETIKSFQKMSPSTLAAYGRNARAAAEQQYNFEVLTQKLVTIIES